MKCKYLILAAAALLSLGACNKEASTDEALSGRKVTVAATAETLTKAAFRGDETFVWQPGDCIGLYTWNTSNTGNYSAVRFVLSEGEGTADAKFTGSIKDGWDYGYVAFYPYYASGTTALNAGYDLAKNELRYPFPADRTNVAVNDTLVRIPMAAALDMSDTGDKNVFTFKHIAGAVKVTLTNLPKNARYFKLWADKNISGWSSITLDQIGEGVASIYYGTSNDAQFSLAEGAECPSEMTFFFPVPCGTYIFGIGVYGDNGSYTYELQGTVENTIERGTILRMPVLTVPDPEPQPQSEWALIGYHDDDAWTVDVPMTEVEGADGWVVAANIAPSYGEIAFKFRKNGSWDDQLSAKYNIPKNCGEIIYLSDGKQVPNFDTHLYSVSENVDIYLNADAKIAAIYPANTNFVAPTTPEFDESTCVYLYVDDQTGWGNNLNVYAYGEVNDLGGKWPGPGVQSWETIGEKTYALFLLRDAYTKKVSLIFSQFGTNQLADFPGQYDASTCYIQLAKYEFIYVSNGDIHRFQDPRTSGMDNGYDNPFDDNEEIWN